MVALCLVLTISIGQLLGSVAGHCHCDPGLAHSHVHLDDLFECEHHTEWETEHSERDHERDCFEVASGRSSCMDGLIGSKMAPEEPHSDRMIAVFRIDSFWIDSTTVLNAKTSSRFRLPADVTMDRSADMGNRARNRFGLGTLHRKKCPCRLDILVPLRC